MIYLVVKPGGDKFRNMYYSHGPHSLGTSWTFKIAEAIWWKTNSQPRLVIAWHKSSGAEVISMTEQEFFKRKLKGK